MTDDFFEVRFAYPLCNSTKAEVIKDVASRHQEYRTRTNLRDPIPLPSPLAGARLFSRTITDWKVPHPKIALDSYDYPIVSTFRTTSKWSLPITHRLLTDHRSGHYVPPGPRSGWSRAQYSVYKEEQASWRKNRDKVRLEGLTRILQQDRSDAERRVPYDSHTNEIIVENKFGKSEKCYVHSLATPGIEFKKHVRNDRESSDSIIDLTKDDVPIDLTGSEGDASQLEECTNGTHGKNKPISRIDTYDQRPKLAPHHGRLLTRTPATPKTSSNGFGTEGQSWYTTTGRRYGAAVSLKGSTRPTS